MFRRVQSWSLIFAWLFASVAIAANPAGASDSPQSIAATVRIKLIAFNDLHGHLEAPHMSIRAPAAADPASEVAVPAGGVARFATLVKQLRAENPNHALVSAGDLVGASPLVSALFLDEPTIEAMNLIGLEFSALGNHEFDKGVAELRRKQTGGCVRDASTIAISTLEPCRGGRAFEGAKFHFLAANVTDNASGKTLFPAYGIKRFDGVEVAFIGVVLRGTPFITMPANVEGYTFRDEANAVNALISQLRAQGVQTFVLLIHQGGAMVGPLNDPRCNGLSGEILPILNKLDPAVSVVVSGHTHQAYVCDYKGFLLTSAASYGRLVTEIDLAVDRKSGKVLGKAAVNRIVIGDGYDETPLPPGYNAVAKDADVDALVRRYADLVRPLAERKVGRISASLSNTPNAAGESALGDVIADAQLAATKNAGAQIAFTNSGGIRAALDYGKDGTVTYAQIFACQPFSNSLVTASMTGAQIKGVLERQFSERGQRSRQPFVLQVSSGFRYAYDPGQPLGDRVVPETLTLNGVPIDPAQSYRVTINSFLAGGGDNFAAFGAASDRGNGIIDVDALEAYLQANSPVVPGPLVRIDRR